MIPRHTESGVLPPFVGDSATERLGTSPYRASMSELAQRFCTSPERAELIDGLLRFRAELRALGLLNGFQWIDGSFIEDVEAVRKRAPADIDLVTSIRRPDVYLEPQKWTKLIEDNARLFDHEDIKNTFRCDIYWIDLSVRSEIIVRDVCYWYGLFSHQRNTFLWKGMLEIPLQSDDSEALGIVQEVFNANKT